MQGVLKERVLKANLLYERTGAIFAECICLNKMVSVENPANSYFWKTLGWVSQTRGLAFQEVVFHNCQHGGQRAKVTRLAHNIDLFSELRLMCPGESQGHQHLPWSRNGKAFATSEEKVYLWTLCRRVADIVLRTLLKRGFRAAPDSMPSGASAQHVEAAAATNTQPRGKKLPPLVPEFAQIITITCNEPLFPGITKIEVKTDLPDNADCSVPITSLPAGSRILRQDIVGVVPATEDSSCEHEHVASNLRSDAALTRVTTTPGGTLTPVRDQISDRLSTEAFASHILVSRPHEPVTKADIIDLVRYLNLNIPAGVARSRMRCLGPQDHTRVGHWLGCART